MQPKDLPRALCLHELVAHRATEAPDATALVHADEHLTYGELDSRSNRVAHVLREMGVGRDRIVGLCVERSTAMVTGLLGILKAGGAYLPLDPAYPRERLDFMLRDSGAPVLVTTATLLGDLPAHDAQVLCLDRAAARIDAAPDKAPVTGTTPDDLAYVIYTSGSTGTPKGALLAHRGLVNVHEQQCSLFGVGPSSRVLQFASLSFDASTFEIVMALPKGAVLVLGDRDELLPGPDLLDFLRRHRVTVVTLTPTALGALPEGDLPDLSTITVAGEACPRELVTRWAPGRRFFNLYGPTEATIWATVAELTADDEAVHIGRPIGNMEAFVLDAGGQPLPVGVPGELHLGGVGLARGYHDRPELTAERFVAHPFDPRPGARLYRTGDRARFLADGNIEFLGRIDHQVKLRGYRIELGEIEAVLCRHAAVSQACVIVREHQSGNERLVAYFVVAPGAAAPSTAELLAIARDSLPDYMVPVALVQLDALPMTPNGKIDRSALPAPPRTRPELATPWAGPENDQQETITGIWAAILDIDRVGIHDDLLELGGHSLLATQIATRICETLGARLPIAALLGGVTPAELDARIESGVDIGDPETPITRVPRDGDLPLSFSQERAWFMQKLAPDALAYQAQAALYLDGALDVPVLERCLTEIVRRHEIYRTSFPERDGQPVQVIHPDASCKLEVVSLDHIAPDRRADEVERRLRTACDVHFDLPRLPLVKWTLFRVDAEHHVLLHVEHHIVHDGWSYHVFLDELAQLYRAYVAGGESPLPELPIQFADFAKWQRDWMETEAAREQLEFWTAKLAGCPTELSLPFDRERPRVPSYQGAAPRLHVSADLRRRITEIAHGERATLFGATLTAFFVLMHRYSGQDDLCVGTGIANRVRRETEPLMGMFINNVTLRCDLSGDPTFRELLAQVRSVLLDAHAHQDVPFDRVVEAVAPRRDASRNPLMQVLFSFQDAPLPDLELPGLTLRVREAQTNGSAKFDLNVVNIVEEGPLGGPDGGGIDMVWEHSTDLFDPGTIDRLASDYAALLEAVADDPGARLSRLVAPGPEERQRLLDLGQGPPSGAPTDRGVHELFAEQAATTPDAVAVAFGGERLTYAELDTRSNQLAHHLRSLGVTTEVRVGIAIERSIEMVVAILGILKAGGAYVPLDTGYPRDRLAYMIEDAGAPLLVTQRGLLDSLPPFDGPVLLLDAEADAIAAHSATALRSDTTSDRLAYVMYTSGSTGWPKGVLVEHSGITRLVLGTNYVSIGEDDVLLQASPIAFDASTFEIWGALLNGARLEVLPPGQPSLEELGEAIASRGVTTLFFTTALFRQMVELQLPQLSGVRQLLMGGETLSPAPVRRILTTLDGDRRVIHCYGPTENTTFTSCHAMTGATRIGRSVPIGVPLTGTQIYVLDRHMQPVPVGVLGRLWTGGDGVSRGYLGDDELTARKFVPDPFSDTPGARLYDTGDEARWLPDGTLDFIGRQDEQVKISGYRIELGEIESALARHAGVREAAAAVRELPSGEKHLVAWFVPRGDAAPDVSDLRAFLRESLTDAMMPASYVRVDALPLTPNGKVDRRALPEPEVTAEFIPPKSDTERELASIWRELFGREAIGVHDDFFELGGNSLLATRLLNRLNQSESFAGLPLHALFEHSTIADLASYVDTLRWATAGGEAGGDDGREAIEL